MGSVARYGGTRSETKIWLSIEAMSRERWVRLMADWDASGTGQEILLGLLLLLLLLVLATADEFEPFWPKLVGVGAANIQFIALPDAVQDC